MLRAAQDCLYLNVWSPEPKPDEEPGQKRPVLVYFHGGDLSEGDASESRYDGAQFAALGVVTVTANYRLGLFGFLALPAQWHESSPDSAGNFGLLDQVAALKWVRENIALFGGDPNEITIAGDFGGAVSVSAHMASPLSRGLFVRAIGHSGGAFGPLAVWSRTQAEQVALRFAAQVGASTLQALRAMPAEQLLAAAGTAADGKFAFWPHVDGEFLTDTPDAVFTAGTQAKVPLLIGNRSKESDLRAVLSGAEATPENWRKALKRICGEKAGQAESYYPGNDKEDVLRSAMLLASDLSTGNATWRWMSLHRSTGSGAPVYFYDYGRVPPAITRASPQAWSTGEAALAADYSLGQLNLLPRRGWARDDYRACGAFLRYVVQFVRKGDPNGPRDSPLRYFSALGLNWPAPLPSWPTASERQGGLARQMIDVEPETLSDASAARQAFIERFIAGQPSGVGAR